MSRVVFAVITEENKINSNIIIDIILFLFMGYSKFTNSGIQIIIIIINLLFNQLI